MPHEGGDLVPDNKTPYNKASPCSSSSRPSLVFDLLTIRLSSDFHFLNCIFTRSFDSELHICLDRFFTCLIRLVVLVEEMRSFALLSLTTLVSAHGLITAAKGNAGGSGSGIGFVPGTAGTSESDVTLFKGNSVCGQTAAGVTNNIASGTSTILSQNGGTLPQVTAGGSLSMTLHQVNADGAGPYTCQISTDATGNTFTTLQATTQVPGNNGVSSANNQDFPLVVSLPSNLQCTGTVAGQSNVCLVRCKNPSGAGRFWLYTLPKASAQETFRSVRRLRSYPAIRSHSHR
jgi:hypothetical protein